MNIKKTLFIVRKNLKTQRKTIINCIVIFIIAISLVNISGMFSNTVTDVLNSAYDSPRKHILTETIYDYSLEVAEKNYNAYKDDPRVSEISKGYARIPYAQCVNANELFGVDYNISYEAERYHQYYKQYSDYKSDLRDDEILVPSYIAYMDYMWEDYFDKGMFYEGEKLIGKTMRFSLDIGDDIYTREYKVVGTFDTVAMQNYGSTVFMSGSEIDFWADKINKLDLYTVKEISPEYDIDSDPLKVGEQYMVVEDFQDLMDIENEKCCFVPFVWVTKEKVDNANYMMDAIDTMGKILFLVCLVIMIMTLVKSYNDRQQEFAVLRMLGYEKKYINRIMSMEIFTINMAGGVISLLICGFLVFALNRLKYMILPVIIAEQYQFQFEGWFVIVGIIVAVLASVITFIILAVKRKKTTLLISAKE